MYNLAIPILLIFLGLAVYFGDILTKENTQENIQKGVYTTETDPTLIKVPDVKLPSKTSGGTGSGSTGTGSAGNTGSTGSTGTSTGEGNNFTSIIETMIVSGPENGKIISDSKTVTFKFEAYIPPQEDKSKVQFETKVDGIDKDWQTTSEKERTITFPASPKEYVFWVRAKIGTLKDSTPDKRTFKMNISPYCGKVKLTTPKLISSTAPSLITINTSISAGESIKITNWLLKTAKTEIRVPQGVEKYCHYYNAYVNGDIYIKQGDIVYFSSAVNPLGKDRNFRPNKCMGYLANTYKFPISITKNCPKPTDSEISDLAVCCQQFIKGLATCAIPDYSKNESVSKDEQCTSYINENLNHLGCFRKYSDTSGFVLKNWHIYLEKDILSDKCDVLYLNDENGFFVDKISYGKPDACK